MGRKKVKRKEKHSKQDDAYRRMLELYTMLPPFPNKIKDKKSHTKKIKSLKG
jgi:hypothetical protein